MLIQTSYTPLSLCLLHRGLKKRCRLSWLTNSALVYEPKCGGGELRGLSEWVQLCTGAQINVGDLTPYLTNALTSLRVEKCLLLTLPVSPVSLVSIWVQFSLCRMYDMEVRLPRIDYKV